jgi:hypothetical protein
MRDFSKVEALLSQLLVASSPAFSSKELAEVQHFIDVAEYGLALETAVGIYNEEKKVATAEVATLVERLAVAMAMDAAPLLSKLPR